MNKKHQISVERLQTRINMLREESRTISHKIEIMSERRKELQEDKKRLKGLLMKLEA